MSTCVREFVKLSWPGSRDWHNWAVGFDESNNTWHLFHYLRPNEDSLSACYRWIHHRHAHLPISEGRMWEVALAFVRDMRLAASGDEIDTIKPTVCRLRLLLKNATIAEGHCLKGKPICFRRIEQVWRPIVRFGTAKRDAYRVMKFSDSEA